MRRFGLIFVSLVPLLFLTGCDLKTTMDYDRDVDFSTIETYKWVGRDHPEISDLEYKKIVSAVDTQLELKGFQKVDSDPDVVVTYFGDNNERTVVDTTHYGYGYGGGWYWGRWRYEHLDLTSANVYRRHTGSGYVSRFEKGIDLARYGDRYRC